MSRLRHHLKIIAIALAAVCCLGLSPLMDRSPIAAVSTISPARSVATAGTANPARPIAAPSEGRYRISQSESRFVVHAYAGGLLSALAHDHNIAIRDFSGMVVFTYHSVTPASLQFTVKSNSLAVTDKVSESDRNKIQTTMRDEVLEVNNYPEITFKSTNVEADCIDDSKCRTKITGDLTLHGTTRAITINALVTFHDASLQAEGQFSIRQSEYGIKPVSVGGGTIKVKDELKFNFNIVANR